MADGPAGRTARFVRPMDHNLYGGGLLWQRTSMTRQIRGDPQGLSFILQLIALLVAIGIASAVFYALFVQHPPTGVGPNKAQPGDTATIEYIGTFEDTGKVFDTSRASVAQDNVSFPKALSFSWRASWQPFSFTLGGGQAIKGFDAGVTGMSVGQSKRIVVPPSEGYGSLNMSLVHVRPLVQEVPARTTMNVSAFTTKYGVAPADGLVVTDPFWGWNDTVIVSANIVTVVNSPYMNMRVRPYGAWTAIVDGIDDTANNGTGIVYVRNLLTSADAGNVQGKDGSQTFIVSAVDPVEGTYTANYNREVVGRTLVFDITLTTLVRP